MTELRHPILQRLYEHGAYEPPSWPARAPNGSAGPAPAPGDPQAARYASAALASEARRVAEAVEGTRNDTLNRAAFRMNQLISNGWLSQQDVYDTLLDAAYACGLDAGESHATITSGLSAHAGGRAGVELHERSEIAPAYTVDPSLAPSGAEVPGSSHDAGSTEASEVEPARDHGLTFKDGETFIHATAAGVPAVWGDDDDVLWAEGEPLILTGPTGAGKTTLGTQVVAGRLGLLADVLGFTVTPGRKRTLVLAMDRPRQIQRAMARLLRSQPRDVLRERLSVWEGPPPMDLARHPLLLFQLAQAAEADTVIIDSLKDAALKLSDEETGQGLSRAMNYCVVNGVEVMAYHHQTKRTPTPNSKPNTLADVYGSSWITAGAGSVVLLWGNAGDLVVEMSHLKQPAAEVGPLAIGHDHTAGTSFLYDGMSDGERLLDLLASGPQTASAVASWSVKGTPDRAAIAKARRRLDKLVTSGLAFRMDDEARRGTIPGAGRGGADGVRYALTETGRRPHSLAHTLTHAPGPLVHGNSVSAGQAMRASKDGLVHASTHDFGPLAHAEDVSADQKTHGLTHAVHAPLTHAPPPPLRGEGRAGGARGGGAGESAGKSTEESRATGSDVEVCARCHQPAQRFIPAPGGKRWCPGCSYPTERRRDHEQDHEEDLT